MKAARLNLAPENSVLVVVRSGILKHTLPVCVATRPVAINQDIKALIPNEKIKSEYLALYLEVFGGRILSVISKHSTTVQSLNTPQLDTLLIPVPPTPIQDVLIDEMKAARSARQQKLAEADALLAGFDGYLLAQLGLAAPAPDARQVFAVRLGQINRQRLDSFFYEPNLIKNEAVAQKYKPVLPLAKLLTKPPMNGLDARDYLEAGQRYLRVQNVKPFELKFDDIKYVSSDSPKDIALQEGDVLLTRKGSFGLAATVPREAVDCLISSEVILLRLSPDANCNPDYLVSWLNSAIAQAILNRHKSGGIMGHLTQDVVSKLPIPLPPKEIQTAIAAEVTRRRTEARWLRASAGAEWAAAKARFEQELLGDSAKP